MTIQTKYNIGDEVWFTHLSRAVKSFVMEVQYFKDDKCERILYRLPLSKDLLFEDHLASTKEELIEML